MEKENIIKAFILLVVVVIATAVIWKGVKK
jgi:hypothetical protein